MKDTIQNHFARHIQTASQVSAELPSIIEKVARLLIDALENGRTLLLCGNGGSAADAQHIATEITGRFMRERKAMPAIALTTDTSALTAIGNDFGFEQIFARQVEALARPGDVLIGITTSGNSANVLEALRAAEDAKCVTVALTGRDGGRAKDLANYAIVIPSDYTPFIQEMHITIAHILCELIDVHFAK
jgi:D-sedoheptulose 7-phosphate isomerase